MKIHFENMLEDMTYILDVSNDKSKIKKPSIVKGGKTCLPKGRLERAKQGILQNKKDKHKNKKQQSCKNHREKEEGKK